MFFKQVVGLCGKFNNKQQDDYTTPGGDIEVQAYKFANSWKGDIACQDVEGPFLGGCAMEPNFEKRATEA